jgi:RNAse (barnase) inhibitor barstar
MSPASTLAPESSGVYRTPADLDALQRRAQASGAAWLEADLQAVRDKTGLLRALARLFAFPSGFGDNWDALADSLQDLSWCPAPAYVVRLRNCAKTRERMGEDWRTFVEILLESTMYWQTRRKPFIVVADEAEDLPAWT